MPGRYVCHWIESRIGVDCATNAGAVGRGRAAGAFALVEELVGVFDFDAGLVDFVAAFVCVLLGDFVGVLPCCACAPCTARSERTAAAAAMRFMAKRCAASAPSDRRLWKRLLVFSQKRHPLLLSHVAEELG